MSSSSIRSRHIPSAKPLTSRLNGDQSVRDVAVRVTISDAFAGNPDSHDLVSLSPTRWKYASIDLYSISLWDRCARLCLILKPKILTAERWIGEWRMMRRMWTENHMTDAMTALCRVAIYECFKIHNPERSCGPTHICLRKPSSDRGSSELFGARCKEVSQLVCPFQFEWWTDDGCQPSMVLAYTSEDKWFE